MRSALLLSCGCWLLGCVVLDASLGEHHPSQPLADAASEEHAAETQGMDAAVHDLPAPEPTPRSEPAPQPEPAADSQPGADSQPADEPIPPADEPAPADMMDMPSEHPPAEEPPMEQPPPAQEPPPAAPACDIATDNPCLLCDQEACCEARQACLEIEGCACHLECRGADNPAACREGCGAMGERYEPWLLCLQEHCADHCAL